MSGPSTPLRTASVETSLVVFRREPTVRDSSTALGMTKCFFAAADVYYDVASRSAAMNMAIDEALLESAKIPTFRFYRWDHAALSFGYFGRFTDVDRYASKRDLVRRWTGGGVVLHGDDLTYSLVIPENDPLFRKESMSIYEGVHGALRDALASDGQRAELVADMQKNVAPISARHDCFTNPVHADVMMNGRKIAGAAQRRTRTGLLHQGSIQRSDLDKNFEKRFACELSAKCETEEIDVRLIARAEEIAAKRYATKAWLQRR
jgi:lipoate-protein ligase A